eukprot:65402-Pelagomonas_calceolata.AAC.1
MDSNEHEQDVGKDKGGAFIDNARDSNDYKEGNAQSKEATPERSLPGVVLLCGCSPIAWVQFCCPGVVLLPGCTFRAWV